MIPKISYRDKKANLISYLGTLTAVIGLLLFASSNAFGSMMPETVRTVLSVIGIIGLLGGLACIGIIWLIMKRRDYDEMMKLIREKNLEPVIAASTEQAVALYKLAPSAKLANYIAELNPEAGAFIAQNRNRLK